MPLTPRIPQPLQVDITGSVPVDIAEPVSIEGPGNNTNPVQIEAQVGKPLHVVIQGPDFFAPDTSGADGFGTLGISAENRYLKLEGGVVMRRIVVNPGNDNISLVPASHGDESSIITAFAGDMQGAVMVRRQITGAATGGQPAVGYYYQHEIFPHYTYLFNTSGHNEDLDGNGGRTGIVAYRTRTFHSGQGDLVAYNAACFVNSTKPGSTHFLANPAVVILNGGAFAGIDGCYLNLMELNATDQGFDCAAIGLVFNFDRSDDTGAKGAYWTAVRPQSKGTASPDCIYSGFGDWKRGISFASVDFGMPQAAIVLKPNQRIYLNGSNTDPSGGGGDSFIVTGDDFIDYDVGIGGIRIVVNNVARLQVVDNEVTLAAAGGGTNFNIADGTLQFGSVISIDENRAYRNIARTAAQIADVTDAINTANKGLGKQVWDSTNHRIMVAEGGAAADAWWVADGSASVTPA